MGIRRLLSRLLGRDDRKSPPPPASVNTLAQAEERLKRLENLLASQLELSQRASEVPLPLPVSLTPLLSVSTPVPAPLVPPTVPHAVVPQAPTESKPGMLHCVYGHILNVDRTLEPDPEGYWPNGSVRRSCPFLSPDADTLSFNKWAWRSVGNRQRHGLSAEVRRCLGVLRCTNTACARVARPRTQATSLREQIKKNCKACGSALQRILCDARTYRYDSVAAGEHVTVWEHEGTHEHTRPPPPSILSRQERAVLDEQVARSPGASVHQLRTGSLLPGSQPLHRISERLVNPRSARHQVAQSQTRLGIPSSTFQKGGFAMLESLSQLNSEQSFIVESSISGPVYIIFQSPYMQQVLAAAIEEWSNDDERSEGRHGMVTDASHSYFRDGQLLTTCVFSAVTLSWVPVQYTWIHGRDTEHHIPHFDRINKYIVKTMGSKFQRKFLAQVCYPLFA